MPFPGFPEKSSNQSNPSRSPTTATIQPGRAGAGPSRAEDSLALSRAERASLSLPSRAEPRPRRAGPSRTEPGRAGPSRARPGRAEPSRAGPSRAEPSRAGPGPTGGGVGVILNFFFSGVDCFLSVFTRNLQYVCDFFFPGVGSGIRAGPGRAEPSGAGPEPSGAGPGRAEPIRWIRDGPGPSRAERGRAEPGRAGPEPGRAEPGRSRAGPHINFRIII